jgi:peptidylprolyl isomerase
MKRFTIRVVVFLLLVDSIFFVVGFGAHAANVSRSEPSLSSIDTQYSQVQDNVVILVTSMGNISIELFADMPITSSNFKNLTQHGIYDGTIFHRVAHNFVIQGGDAISKGIVVPTIPDELPNKHSNVRGSVAMAKTSQPNSATSQFYINLVNNTFLDPDYSVFGQVFAGMNVVDSIGSVQTYPANDGQPLTTITINSAHVVPEYSQLILLTLFAGSTFLAIMLRRKKMAQRTRSPSRPIDEASLDSVL